MSTSMRSPNSPAAAEATPTQGAVGEVSLTISTSMRSPNSPAAAEATPTEGEVDEVSQKQPPEGNQSDNNSSGGADETDKDHRDRISMQTAALAALTFSVQLLVNLPKVVEPKLQFVYEANVAILFITFLSAIYTFLHAFCKLEPAARLLEKKLIVPIYVSIAITFTLHGSLHVVFTVSLVGVLLITAVASLLGWIYLRRT